jgi:hypothetical protein
VDERYGRDAGEHGGEPSNDSNPSRDLSLTSVGWWHLPEPHATTPLPWSNRATSLVSVQGTPTRQPGTCRTTWAASGRYSRTGADGPFSG